MQPQAAVDGSPSLAAGQIAEMLGVKVTTVYAWTERGIIPCVRIGKRIVRYELAEVRAWIATRRVPGRTSKEVARGLLGAAESRTVSPQRRKAPLFDGTRNRKVNRSGRGAELATVGQSATDAEARAGGRRDRDIT